MRHRVTIQDVAFVMGVLTLIGVGAYEYSFITGSVHEDKRVEFEEMLLLGALTGISVLYLGWRRVRDQEREIKRRVAAERRAHELAHTDALTGLANRREFEAMLGAAFALPRGPNEVHAVLMLDLNGFKRVNDVYGHGEGDDVLVGVAGRLRAATRDRDLIARLGGDEFAVLARNLSSAESASNVALRIIKELAEPISVEDRRHSVGAGVGIALIPRDGATPEEVLRKADIALYRAKAETDSAVRFFENAMDRQLRERDTIERELARSVGTDMLRPWYQPIVELQSKRIVGFEALARWTHPEFGEVSPERFIPIAENSGLIGKVSGWLLRCAARDAAQWPADVMLSFNISPAEMKDRALGPRILAILGETGLSPHRLEIEITESAIVQDMEAAKEMLSMLRAAGIKIAVDDFGTGYSSLYHLRSFELDKIKIDRSFIHAMNSEQESAAIVRALTGLGKGLGLTVVAEGIEDGSEREMLVREGCQQGQGFLFSAAVPAEETAALFARGKATNAA